jgi:phospholipase C
MNHTIKGILIVIAIASMLVLGATTMIPIMQNSFAHKRSDFNRAERDTNTNTNTNTNSATSDSSSDAAADNTNNINNTASASQSQEQSACAVAVTCQESSTTVTPGLGGAAIATPIKHLVILFQENIPFDHYFGTYPHALNPPGQPSFTPSSNTPANIDNLITSGRLFNNPNLVKPFRLDRSEAITNDNNHTYTAEQKMYDAGRVDRFVEENKFTPNFLAPFRCPSIEPVHQNPRVCFNPAQVMGYYDGNTVTALWNYAQHFAMSDSYYQTNYGPSSPGHINLVSGQTHGAIPDNVPRIVSQGTMIGNPDPKYDDCSLSAEDTFLVPYFPNPVPNASPPVAEMTGRNIGDLLNAKDITWGWFSAGFKPTPDSKAANCSSSMHDNGAGVITHDYYAVVEPFQYYKSTANPHHLPPTSVAMIGHTDQANHQYDLSDFWNAAESGNLPAVSFLKAPSYQQGHAGYSSPLLEQNFLVDTINRIQKLPQWDSTAVIITYDDSDGWYDHVMPPLVSRSNDPIYDALFGPEGLCGHTPPGTFQDRCGYGPRLVLLAISPFSKVNFIDHHVTDQTSILRFIEDNWLGGHRIGDHSLDAKAGSLTGMFDFASRHNASNIFLDPIGNK